MKKIDKIKIYTILIFCISAFSCFPKSYSKYIKEEEPVRYYVGIEKLYIGDIGYNNLTILNTSTYKTANYEFKFNRSQVMKDGDNNQQVYIEIKQPSCQISKIISKGSVSKNGNNATITYTSKGTDSITVNYSCDVSSIIDNQNKLETDIEIYEKFMPENIKYLYAKIDDPGITSVEYYKLYPKPIAKISDDAKTLTLPVDIEDKYSEFKKWINEYISKMSSTYGGDYSLEINSYVNSIYNESNILDLSKNLKGLTVTYDSTNKVYIYKIDDNFLGYAMTYQTNQISSGLTKVVFSNNNLSDEEANEILKYYFTTYSEYNADEINQIMLYVSNYESINYMLIPNQDGTHNEIEGFVYLPDSSTDTNPDQIAIDYRLMQLIDAFFNKKIIIPFDKGGSMHSFFIMALTSTFDFVKPNSSLYNALTGNANIFYSIIKNGTDMTTTPKAYTDYIPVQDTSTGKYVLVKIYSDGLDTRVEIKKLAVAKALTITATTNSYDISMTLDNSDVSSAKQNAIAIISGIDTHLGTNYKEQIVDILFTTSTKVGDITSVIDEVEKTVTISYSITQQ